MGCLVSRRNREIGVTGLQKSWSGAINEEFIPQLKNGKSKKVYREMSENDPDIAAFITLYKAMSMSQPVQVLKATGDTSDELVDFVESCMEDMDRSWQEFRAETMSMLVYGYSLFETVFKKRTEKNSRYPDGKLTWQDFSPRAQETIERWQYDTRANAIAAIQRDPETMREYTIPLTRCIHFRTSSTKNNPEGFSLLRPAYRHWFFKKQTEELRGIVMERDATGVIHITMPRSEMYNADGSASTLFQEVETKSMQISGMYRSSIVTPGEEEYDPATGVSYKTGWSVNQLASPGKRLVDFNETIKMLRNQLLTSVSAQFMLLGQGETGSNALARSQEEAMRMTIDYLHASWCHVMNHQALPKLLKLNGYNDPSKWPSFHIDPIKRDLSPEYLNYVKTLTELGFMGPDEDVSHIFKKMLSLPVEKV